MFKCLNYYILFMFFSFALSRTIANNILEEYICEELGKDETAQKRNRILEFVMESMKKYEIAELNLFKELRRSECFADMLQDPLSDDNPINALAMVVCDINKDVSAETIKEIIEKSDNCLERLSKTEQFGFKTLLNCIKFSIHLHIKG